MNAHDKETLVPEWGQDDTDPATGPHATGAAFWNGPGPVPGGAATPPTDRGLASGEAHARLERYGANQVQADHHHNLPLQFLLQFRNPLVILLLIASVIAALTGDWTGAVIIAIMVLLSVTLTVVQEHQAGKAAEQLRASIALRAHVLRDGRKMDIPAAAIVPGDIVLVSAGDLIPADARVLEARDFFVNQALLTGEPYPVEKFPGDLPAPADLTGATNAAFMGTSVVSGSATLLVCRTGRQTSLGGIAAGLAKPAPQTAFEAGTRRFGYLIMRLTLLLVIFVVIVNAWFHKPMLESILFALALAVGLTPELLPMVVTVTLSRGAQRMAKQAVIVKQLMAIQNLGSMDVLCTDKTGTLTEARIHLEQHLDLAGQDSEWVLKFAYLNSYFETGLKSPLDDAILSHETMDVSHYQKIDEVPFDFERRRVSVLVDDGQERWLIVKGAPEDVLHLSTLYATGPAAAPQPFDDNARSKAQALNNTLAQAGFRVLGIAFRIVPQTHPHAVVTDETELVFAGFAAFLDPPKASAAGALRHLARNGIRTKIITGDNELVTRHICGELGLPVKGVLTGTDLEKMDEAALRARVGNTTLFCRVNPAQKNRVILALKARGYTVGYLGDGVNDAPALHSADIGISVDSAVDVAREAAEIILLRQDLDVLHAGVMEGRRTFGNVMKYIMMGTSSNFGNMFSMAGAALFLPFLPMLPLQILLNNFLYDVSEVPIPLDHVDPEYLARPHQWNLHFIRNFMLIIGPISSVFDFLTFFVMLRIFHAAEPLFHTGWFVESLATQVLVIFIIRTRKNPFKSRPGRWLAITSLAVVAVAFLLPYSPAAHLLGFTPLPPFFFLILALMVAAYLFMVEGAKRWFYRHFAR